MDYEASLEHTNLEINVVHLSSDYFVVPEEDMAHLQFDPREAVFQKPQGSLHEGTHQRKAGDSHASGWWGHCKSYALVIV